MTEVALIFPGQGAQYVGMGKEFYDSSSDARQIFDTAEDILNNGFLSAIFDGPQEKLTLTAYCQPAIFTFSIAALKALEKHPKFKNIQPAFAAGLSLGEYSALAAAKAFSFEEGLRLVERRSALMDEATKATKGAMAAIIGFDKNKLIGICKQTGAQVANFNSPGQIVITGYAEKVQEASRLIKDAGARSVIPLDVSGAFHSSLMEPAALKFEQDLKKVTIKEPVSSVISNVDGMPETTPLDIQRNLAKQITSSVQWVDSIEYIAKEGIKDFIEIGPGKVLKGLIRRIDSSLKVYNIEKPADIHVIPF